MGYGEVDVADAEEAGLFALPALFITFRETLEAAIIISVLLGLLDKLNAPQLKRYVWIGALSALLLCIGGAAIVLVLVNVLKDELLDGSSEALMEGIVGLVAGVLIGYVALSIGKVMGMHDKIEARIQSNVDASEEAGVTRNMILFLAFTAVAREGLETIIFFTGIGANYPPKSLPIPAVTGAIIGAVCGVALYRFGGRLTLQWFFRLTMVILILVGAGVWTNAIHSLQTYGAFGVWEPEEDRAPINQEIFDLSGCCGLDNEFWVMMRVLFGYQPVPTPLELLMYALYISTVVLCIVVRYKRAKAGKPPAKQALKAFFCGRCTKTDVAPEAETKAEDDPATSHDSPETEQDADVKAEAKAEAALKQMNMEVSDPNTDGKPGSFSEDHDHVHSSDDSTDDSESQGSPSPSPSPDVVVVI